MLVARLVNFSSKLGTMDLLSLKGSTLLIAVSQVFLPTPWEPIYSCIYPGVCLKQLCDD